MAISIFDGNNQDAYWWVLCLEKHFKVNRTSEELKVTEVVAALRGHALKWWLWWDSRHPRQNWNTFTTDILWRFKPEWRHILPVLDEEIEQDSDSLNSIEASSFNGDSVEQFIVADRLVVHGTPPPPAVHLVQTGTEAIASPTRWKSIRTTEVDKQSTISALKSPPLQPLESDMLAGKNESSTADKILHTRILAATRPPATIESFSAAFPAPPPLPKPPDLNFEWTDSTMLPPPPAPPEKFLVPPPVPVPPPKPPDRALTTMPSPLSVSIHLNELDPQQSPSSTSKPCRMPTCLHKHPHVPSDSPKLPSRYMSLDHSIDKSVSLRKSTICVTPLQPTAMRHVSTSGSHVSTKILDAPSTLNGFGHTPFPLSASPPLSSNEPLGLHNFSYVSTFPPRERFFSVPPTQHLIPHSILTCFAPNGTPDDPHASVLLQEVVEVNRINGIRIFFQDNAMFSNSNFLGLDNVIQLSDENGVLVFSLEEQ